MMTPDCQPTREGGVSCTAWLGRVLVACEYSGSHRRDNGLHVALISTLPPPPKWHACTAKPEHVARLRAECQAVSPSPTPLGDTLAGIRLYAKPGQVADAWMFSDNQILRKYLNDELSELDLMDMIASGACHPNGPDQLSGDSNQKTK